MNQKKLKLIFLYLTVFLVGTTGMIVEFSAIRLVAPFFGSSMDIWAIDIAVIMAGMALGYFIGGILSQKFKDLSLLVYGIIGLAGLLIGLSYLLLEPIVNFTSFSPRLVNFSLSLKEFFVVLSLFFLPMFLLGLIYPLIIASLKDQKPGQASGLVFAVSTLGSIFGSLLPSFMLIPLVGTKLTFFLTGVILEIIAFLGLTKWFKIFPVVVVVFFAIIVSPHRSEKNISPSSPGISVSPRNSESNGSSQENIVYQTESIYQKIKVIKQVWGYTLSLGDNNYFSSYYSASSFLTGQYYDYYSLLPLIRSFNQNLDVLIIGLGGGTISRQYQHFYSESHSLTIDGVEIDPEVVKVGKMFFELEQPSLNIYEMDGRVFLNRSPKKYDIIILDAYAHQSYIPSHLATQEFLQIVKSHLKDSGIVAFNVSASSSQEFRFKAICNTVKSVFDHSYYFTPEETANFMVLASPSDFVSFFNLPLQRSVPQELESIVKGLKNVRPELIQTIDPNYVLKDDTAPERL